MATDDLQFTHLFADLDPVWEKLQQPIRASSRLKYTALSVCGRYIGLGSSTGAVYVFDKTSLRLLHHLPGDKEGAIVNLCFAPNENVLANATSEGRVVVTELNISKRSGSRQLKTITEQRGSNITDMAWNETATQLFIGDDRGRVLRVNVSLNKAKDILQAPNEFIVRSESGEVVQLCMLDGYLLVSTWTRTWLCDTNRREYFPIGKQERAGRFGSCFYLHSGQTRVLCARPKSRVWEATLQGQVVNTHQMKHRLAAPGLPVVQIRDEPLNLHDASNDPARPRIVNFYNLLPFSEDYIFTWSDDGIYVFDLRRPNSLILSNIRGIVKADVCNNEIYYLDSGSHVVRVTMVTPDRLAAILFSKELFTQSARICAEYSFYVALRVARRNISKEMLESLVSKSTDDDLLEAKLHELINNLETADESSTKIVPFDGAVTEREVVVDTDSEQVVEGSPQMRIIDEIVVEIPRKTSIVHEDETAHQNGNEFPSANYDNNLKTQIDADSRSISSENAAEGTNISDIVSRTSLEDDDNVSRTSVENSKTSNHSTATMASNNPFKQSDIESEFESEVASDAYDSQSRAMDHSLRPRPISQLVNGNSDGGSYSESEVTGGLMPVLSPGICDSDASPRSQRKKKKNARKAKPAVVVFGEPMGKKNVKGNIVAYDEVSKSSEKIVTNLAVPTGLVKSRSFSLGDNQDPQSALSAVENRRSSFATDGDAVPQPVPVSVPVPVPVQPVPVFAHPVRIHERGSGTGTPLQSDAEESASDVVPVPFHTSGQPADPTLRKLKQFSEKFKSNSQVFLKNLKENLKEKAIDSFRENWAVDPMNAYFYQEELSEAHVKPEILSRKEVLQTETIEEEKVEDPATAAVRVLEESTKITCEQLASFAQNGKENDEKTRRTLTNWLLLLHRTMNEVGMPILSFDAELHKQQKEENPESETKGDDSAHFALSSTSSSDSDSTTKSRGRFVALHTDPLDMSDSNRSQIGELLCQCVVRGIFDGVVDLHREMELNVIVVHDVNDTITSTSTNPFDEEDDVDDEIGQEEKKSNSNPFLEEIVDYQSSGPLRESTSKFVSLMKCYYYYFEPNTLRTLIHEMERAERYRVWLDYMRCSQALAIHEPLSRLTSKFEVSALRLDDLRSELVKSRADLAHLESLFRRSLPVAESLCISLSDRIGPLDILYLIRYASLPPEVLLRYMDHIWRKANDSELIMTSLCSDEELKERWLDVLLTASNVNDNDVKCECGMPRPFTHIYDWPSRSLIESVLHFGARPSHVMTRSLWERGMWMPWLQYGGRRFWPDVLVIGVVVQLGDTAGLVYILNDSSPNTNPDPSILQMIVDAKSDQTEDVGEEPVCWKCIECQRHFDLDSNDHYGPFSVPPHRIMTWERLAQMLVEKFGLETCLPVLKSKAPTQILRQYLPEEEVSKSVEIAPTELESDPTLFSASVDVTGQSPIRTFTPVNAKSPVQDGWTSMESFVDFWAPKSSPTTAPTSLESRKESLPECVGKVRKSIEDGEASSESSAAHESPRLPRKRFSHKTKRNIPIPHPDDVQDQLMPEKRTPPRRGRKSMEQRLDEWELVPEKWMIGQEPVGSNRRSRKKSLEAAISGKLKGLMGIEDPAAARERLRASVKSVEMTPVRLWPSNNNNYAPSRDALNNAIHKKSTSRKSSSGAKLVNAHSPCVICGNPLLDVVGGKDANVSIFPCLHGYHRACILSDDKCIKCFIDQQRKMIEGK